MGGHHARGMNRHSMGSAAVTKTAFFAEPLFVNIFTCKARKASKDELASLLTEFCIKMATEPSCAAATTWSQIRTRSRTP